MPMADISERVRVVEDPTKSYAETAQRRMVVTFRSPNRADLDTTHVRNEALRVAAANGVPGGGITNMSVPSPVTSDGSPITTPDPVAGQVEFEVTVTVQGTV
jgi:hypothetical protein